LMQTPKKLAINITPGFSFNKTDLVKTSLVKAASYDVRHNLRNEKNINNQEMEKFNDLALQPKYS